MAQKIETLLIDDLSGESADETVTFGFDGTAYEIDLTKANAGRLREAMAEYIAAARKAGSVKSQSTGERMPRETAQAMRAWAAANGIELASRGRIPHAVVSAYQEAN